MTKLRTSMLCGVCIALCTALNFAFASPGTFSQFYIPLFLCLLVCPAPYAVVCAVASPLISAAVCGHPLLPLLPGMLAECLVFTLICLAFFRFLHGAGNNTRLILTLICAVALGRLSAGLLNAVLFTDGRNAAIFWTTGTVLKALPDILVLTAVSVELKTLAEKCGWIRGKPDNGDFEKYAENRFRIPDAHVVGAIHESPAPAKTESSVGNENAEI